MAVLPEPRFAEHDHATPNRWIADLESLPGCRAILENALHGRPILIRPDGSAGRRRRCRLRGESSVERRCYGQGACPPDGGSWAMAHELGRELTAAELGVAQFAKPAR